MNLAEQFEKYHLYRRLVVLYAGLLALYVTVWAFRYAFAALEVNEANLTTAAIIATILIPTKGVFCFVTKLYWNTRDAANTNS